MEHPLKAILQNVRAELVHSSVGLPLPLKLRMAELVLYLQQQREAFGLFVILGWRNRWNRFVDTPDMSQDIFRQHRMNIFHIDDGQSWEKHTIMHTVDFDGAILVNPQGTVLHSGTMIEGLYPRAVAQKLRPNHAGDLSSQFGFIRKVHMRHITAITSSYVFKDTTVFTVSEETSDFHIFENGRIIHSTVRGEVVPARARPFLPITTKQPVAQ